MGTAPAAWRPQDRPDEYTDARDEPRPSIISARVTWQKPQEMGDYLCVTNVPLIRLNPPRRSAGGCDVGIKWPPEMVQPTCSQGDTHCVGVVASYPGSGWSGGGSILPRLRVEWGW